MQDQIRPIVKQAGKTLWIVVDGGYVKAPVLKRALRAGVTVIGRLRKDAALRDLPRKLRRGRRRGRGRPPKYGKNKSSLAKRAAHRKGWETGKCTVYGKTVTKLYKTFLATYRPVGGLIRVVIVEEDHDWYPFFSTDPNATAVEIIEALSGTGSIDTTARNPVFNVVIKGSVGLTKTGSGTLTLSKANIYTGDTTISEGTLRVNNTTGSGTDSGAVTVNSGATLGGTGRISGAVTIGSGGILAPGNGAGTLTMGSATPPNTAYTYTASTATDYQVNLEANSSHNYTTSLTTTTLETFEDVYTFGVQDNAGVSGTGTGTNLQLTPQGIVVPEPGTFALLVTGLLAMLAYAWRSSS